MNPADLLDLIRLRQSQRSYKDQPVEKEKLERCIEAARLAPSACNAQPWKFIIIDNPELKNAVADLATEKLTGMNHFTRQAPVHVAIVREAANLTSTLGQVIKNKEYPLIDIGIATAHFCLQARAEGLSTCILGWFNEKKVKELLQIPKSKRLELIILVGYPADEKIRVKNRKSTDEVRSYNRY
jgi:nitroreductase